MSYPGPSNRGMVGDDYLTQRVGGLSLQNEYQEGMSYNAPPSNPYEQTETTSWDYQTNEGTRNLDAVVAEMTPEEVRWFYKMEAEKRWVEFSGYDSYRIEMRYREMFNKGNFGSQYSSYSAFSDSPSSLGNQFGSSSIRFPGKQNQPGQYHEPNAPMGQHQHKIVVRGGLYDVNFDTWQCASIYWPGEECAITRGMWFYDSWQPLEREQSTVLENKHLSLFRGRKMSDYNECEAKGTVLHTETFPDCFVEWFSPGQIYLYSENKPSKIVRSVTSRLGFHKSTGYRLFRGYKTEATLDDRPDVEITHLVFVIHGIGQKMDTGRIIRNTSSLRDCVSWLKQKYFTSYPHHRAEFFPVEWRSNLQLDGELVDAITPNTLQSLRQMLNASAMDIMYYTSPLYGSEVQRGLREELNRLYSMFTARNPYFANKGGKISVIAHSLGCVILYDIIMGLKPGSLMHNAQQGLLFQIQNFFCLGSPLAVFLALRWKDSQIPGKMSSILPARLCHRLYNVFHPTDPVAYRIEPLLVKDYFRIAPLVIQPYNSTLRVAYSEMPLEMQGPDQTASQSDNPAQSTQFMQQGPISPGRGLDYRLDYILRESSMGVSYLSALTSHTAYWTNYDIAYFILTQIFPELEAGVSGIQPDPLDRPPLEQWDYNEPYNQPQFNTNPSFNQNFGTSNPSTFQPPYHGGASGMPGTQTHQPGTSGMQQGMGVQQGIGMQPGLQQKSLGMYDQGTTGIRQDVHSPFPGQNPSMQQQHGMSQQQQNIHQQPMHQQNQGSMQQPLHQQNQGLMQQPMHQQNSAMNQQQMMRNSTQQHQQQQQQQKLGFFDRAAGAMDMKQQQQQHASSPTKPKSFFPSFNLSSITSPVKNLSNSLSNISNQMTNIASHAQIPQHPNQGQHQQNPQQQQQQQQQRTGFLGGMMQNKPAFAGQTGQFGQQPHPQQGPQGQQYQTQQQYDQQMSHQGYPQGHQQGAQQHYGPGQQGQAMYSPDQHGYQGPGHQIQLGPRSSSPYNQPRSGSPQGMQPRGGSLLQFGPLETPTGAIKPKIRMQQPKVPTAFTQADMMAGASVAGGASQRGRSVSPLGQSKVVCSRGTLPSSLPNSLGVLPSYGSLGGRSLSSGNLLNSSVVTGGYSSYTARPSTYTASSPTASLSSSLSRRTMSRPNLSSGSSASGSTSALGGFGMASLAYSNSAFSTSGFGTKSYLNRDYSGPSSR